MYKLKNKRIKINHIGYTVLVRDINKYPQHLGGTVLAVTEKLDNNTSAVFFDYTSKIGDGTIAHELTHVLQNICDARSIDFITETEHVAYIMHFLFNEVTGKEYDV